MVWHQRHRRAMNAPEPELDAFLVDAGLAKAGAATTWTPLTGGVSSDIWRVETEGGQYCVKRALATLKVAAKWEVSTDRNAFEWAYMQLASTIAPGHVPHPVAHDPARGLFAMAWLEPAQHRLWKDELLAGRVDPADAARVGALLGQIHGATAAMPALADQFATDENFHALRIDAYLLATARAHPDLAPQIEAAAGLTARTKLALVHGDVSPKNIMLGPDGPILLDSECAWWGDPAFDLAFCLNHLLIKSRVVAGAGKALAASFNAMIAAYLPCVTWEDPSAVEARAATLLPMLALARVDGKSPVEYLDEPQRATLRGDARAAIGQGGGSLAGVWTLLGSG
jgi:aminoglycoside phosphotransferase (APT) family kinase protein